MCERVNPIEEIVKFLKEAETNYKATVEGDQPRVCPFGIAQKYWVQAPPGTTQHRSVGRTCSCNTRIVRQLERGYIFSVLEKRAEYVLSI